jgi:putative DNA-invertase from lambdoid prophage Rac
LLFDDTQHILTGFSNTLSGAVVGRIFGYSRVSTNDGRQHTENQRIAIQGAGYTIAAKGRRFEDQISGSTPAMTRPQFAKMMDRLEEGDTVVVKELSRLGRDAIDVMTTVKSFKNRGIKLVVLQLGNLDLTSPSGELMVNVIAAVAQMEKALLVERVNAGLARVKAEGKVRLGRPTKTTPLQQHEIRARKAEGVSISQLARDYAISRATVLSIVAQQLRFDR